MKPIVNIISTMADLWIEQLQGACDEDPANAQLSHRLERMCQLKAELDNMAPVKADARIPYEVNAYLQRYDTKAAEQVIGWSPDGNKWQFDFPSGGFRLKQETLDWMDEQFPDQIIIHYAPPS